MFLFCKKPSYSAEMMNAKMFLFWKDFAPDEVREEDASGINPREFRNTIIDGLRVVYRIKHTK